MDDPKKIPDLTAYGDEPRRQFVLLGDLPRPLGCPAQETTAQAQALRGDDLVGRAILTIAADRLALEHRLDDRIGR